MTVHIKKTTRQIRLIVYGFIVFVLSFLGWGILNNGNKSNLRGEVGNPIIPTVYADHGGNSGGNGDGCPTGGDSCCDGP